MSAADSESLILWSHVYAFCELFVVIGVILEGFEIFWRRRPKIKSRKATEPWFSSEQNSSHEPRWVKTIGDIGWLILVAALFFAQKAYFRIEDITNLENGRLTAQLDLTTKSEQTNEVKVAQLNKEAADARVAAGNAERDAGQANERAAKFDSDRVMVEKEAEEIRSTNFLLQAKVLELEARFQPRTITDQQVTNFIELTKKLPKTPIIIYVGFDDYETHIEARHYVKNVRDMFDAAGYGVTGKSIIELKREDYGDKRGFDNDYDVACLIPGAYRNANGEFHPPGLKIAKNGYEITFKNATPFAAFCYACISLYNDEIKIRFMEITSPSKSNDFGIFIPERFH